MRGHDHALFGLAGYAGALLVGHLHFDLDLPEPAVVVLGGVVALGSGLAADIDEEHSISSQGAGIFGSLARVVTSIGGGHRTVTHYPLLWMAGLTALCFALITGTLGSSALAVVVGVFVALGFPFIVGPRRRSRLGPLLDLVTCAVAVGAGWFVLHTGLEPGWWLYAAIPIPYLTHLLGDTPTPQGIAWLFPFSRRRISLGLFHSGGPFERLVVTPVLVLACTALVYALYQHGAFTGDWLSLAR